MDLAKLHVARSSPVRAGHLRLGAVEQVLAAVRSHLGMDIAFASRVSNGKVVIQYADPRGSTLLDVGDAFEAEKGYCQRIIDGRLPFLIPDTSRVAEAAQLDCTHALPVGAHLSVPMRMSDGSVYGTFCCFSRHPDPSLNQRDLHTLEAFAEIAAAQIEEELCAELERQGALERIRTMIEEHSIQTQYQPIQRLADGAIVGVEALSRFPDQGLRPPSAWFEEAEEVGLGRALELEAIRSALSALAVLPDKAYLAINASPDTLLDPELWYVLRDVPDKRIVLEVTEHRIVDDYKALGQALGKLRDKVRIAVDDVGAGYSGLQHILGLKPDIIKLDLSLTRDIDKDPARRALTSALVGFSRHIECTIVAEGVERFGEYAVLRELGVDCAQGHFLQPPLAMNEVAEYARERHMHKAS